MEGVDYRPDADDPEAGADEGEDCVSRGAPSLLDLAHPARQETLPTGVEDQPRLGVGACDQCSERGGETGEIREDRQHADRAVGDADERDGGAVQLRHVVAEPGHRRVREEQVAHEHDPD